MENHSLEFYQSLEGVFMWRHNGNFGFFKENKYETVRAAFGKPSDLLPLHMMESRFKETANQHGLTHVVPKEFLE